MSLTTATRPLLLRTAGGLAPEDRSFYDDRELDRRLVAVLSDLGQEPAEERPDVADDPFTLRNSRWRTWLRAHTPDLPLLPPGPRRSAGQQLRGPRLAQHGDGLDRCYHCKVTRVTRRMHCWCSPNRGAIG